MEEKEGEEKKLEQDFSTFKLPGICQTQFNFSCILNTVTVCANKYNSTLEAACYREQKHKIDAVADVLYC